MIFWRLTESPHFNHSPDHAAHPNMMLDTTNAKVYLDKICDHPGDGWTRFVCISDNHSRKFDVPSGDVLLHAGDLSSWGEYKQLEKTVKWLETLDHPTKMYTICYFDPRRNSNFIASRQNHCRKP